MNNLRGDQPAKLGLDYAALGKINRSRRVLAHLGLRSRQRAHRVARLRFLDAGRGGAHELDRRAGRAAGTLRSVDHRLHDGEHRDGRFARVHARRATQRPRLRRGRVALRRRAAPVRLRGHVVSEQRRGRVAPRAQQPLLALARADVPDGGRLDLRHVHDREVLERAARRARSAAARPRSALRRRQHAPPSPPRAHGDSGSGVSQSYAPRNGLRGCPECCRSVPCYDVATRCRAPSRKPRA